MDLLSRAFAQLRAVPQSRGSTGPWGDSSIPPNSLIGSTGTAGPVTEGGALAISAVMSCLRVLHDDMRMLPFAAYTGDKFGARQALKKQPLIVTAPFGPDYPVAVGMAMIVVSLKLRGNAYLMIEDTDALAFPTLLSVLHPDYCTPFRDDNGLKKFKVRMDGGGTEIYGTDRIKHITGLMMPGALAGLDPITYQRQMFGFAADVATYGRNFFSGGGSPSVVIEVPGFLDREKLKDVKDGWESSHGGAHNSHRPAVISGGATARPLSIAPENAQFLQTRAFSREEICGWFGVPLQRIMAIVEHASQGGGKGIDSIDTGYATHTLTPLTTSIEGVWDEMIPGAQKSWTFFDLDGLLRADPLTRAHIAQQHRLIGVRNRNEIRAAEGWSPIPGPDGEDYNAPFATNSTVAGLKDPNLDTGQPAPDAPSGGSE